jgi:hypothetical protein
MTRREALWIGAAGCCVASGGDWDRIPRSRYFGIDGKGRPRDAASLYRLEGVDAGAVSFDISNQRITASLDRAGNLDRVCIATGVMPLPYSLLQGGVYTAKTTIRAKDVRFMFGETSRPGEAVELLDGLVPEFRWADGERKAVFAPSVRGVKPRAIVCLARCSRPLDLRGIAGTGRFVKLPAGMEGAQALAYVLEEDDSCHEKVVKDLQERSAWEWLRGTLGELRARYGRLDVPYFGEALVRSGEACRQSILEGRDGEYLGGFMGSDVDGRDTNWNKDNYYNLLGAGMTDAARCARAVDYYFEHGVPMRPSARGLARFPDAGRVTQSLSLAVAPMALAATYYRWSGDKSWFAARKEFLERAKALTDSVLASRRGEVFLFPSMFVSNGDSRGHYHTGSNVVAWYAFAGMARVAREVYGDARLARLWGELANKLRAAIERYCLKNGPLGMQYVEGVFEDETYVPGHDGEETDTSLMPFYGYCEARDPHLARHAKVGLSPVNPYYAAGLDGIWWHNHGGFRPATAPAWITGLASVETKAELETRLARVRGLMDVDGSLWWWPYVYGETRREAVRRGNGTTKCGWSAAGFALYLVENCLGARVDVPARTLRFAPFCSWAEWKWEAARLGDAVFDLEYRMAGGKQQLAVRNRNAVDYEVEFATGVVTKSRAGEWAEASVSSSP